MSCISELRENRLTPFTGIKTAIQVEGYCFPTLRKIDEVHAVNLGSETLPKLGYRKHAVDVVLASPNSVRVVYTCHEEGCTEENRWKDVSGHEINSHKIVNKIAFWDPNRNANQAIQAMPMANYETQTQTNTPQFDSEEEAKNWLEVNVFNPVTT